MFEDGPSSELLFGNFLFPLFVVVLALWILWDRRRRSKGGMIADGPPGEPYKIFTREFDLELHAERVPGALREASPDFYKGWSDIHGSQWQRAIEAAESLSEPDNAAILEALRGKLVTLPFPTERLAVTLLVDQSGSMRGEPATAVAKAVQTVAAALSTLGVTTEILGFSTAGWQGGHVRQRWLKSGRRPRPGRLCALLHIIYKSNDVATWSEASQRAMLHPDILRENVDGEALEWAWGRLKAVPADRKLLIVLSDGAPVDDSTLQQNGPNYLERHLLATIAKVESDPQITLGAIGINHEVKRYYRHSRQTDLAEIAANLSSLVAEMSALPATA